MKIKNIPSDLPICKGCVLEKLTAKSHPLSMKRATKPLELVHADLNKLPTLSYNKFKYVIDILDAVC